MKKLCGCGTCEQAIERGAEFVLKQIRDGDCPGFIMGVLDAAYAVLGSAAAMDTNGRHDALVTMVAHAWLDSARHVVTPVLVAAGPDLNNRVYEALKMAQETMKKEQDLPKGD